MGVEYRPIPALAVLMPAGTKLLVVNPAVRRGVMMLQKENVFVLGGVVSADERAGGQACLDLTGSMGSAQSPDCLSHHNQTACQTRL